MIGRVTAVEREKRLSALRLKIAELQDKADEAYDAGHVLREMRVNEKIKKLRADLRREMNGR